MIQRLFVNGTLVPGGPNEHVLSDIGGSWEAATVSGTLRQEAHFHLKPIGRNGDANNDIIG
jgi:hypothetical protein